MVVLIERMNMGLASGIGLVSEVIHSYNKQETEHFTASVDQPIHPQVQSDKHVLQLDEMQDELSPQKPTQKAIRNPSHLAEDFLQRYPAPSSEAHLGGALSRPVIIPQRRPKVRERGFVRAYAPDLMQCGVDQDTFMDFLITFTRASRAPAWMGAFNLMSGAAFALPGHAIGAGVGFAIQVVNAIAMELKGRSQSNSFLQKLNQGFFQPRGLYCLVMSFDDTHEEAMTVDALTSKVSSTMDPKTGIQRYTSKFRSRSGTFGPEQFPEAAPLVFPELDWLAANADMDQAKKLGEYKKFRKFVADYYDRRAQMEYASRNAESPLAAPPQRPFTSKYADPTDSTNMSPISLATGGIVKYNTTWRPDSTKIQERNKARKQADKVLYMVIVNMPSEEDMKRAKQILETTA